VTALTDIPADQIVRYSPETVVEWLMARNEQHRAGLRAACHSLRADVEARRSAEKRLRAAVVAAAGKAGR
jgi:hypothetical protein